MNTKNESFPAAQLVDMAPMQNQPGEFRDTIDIRGIASVIWRGKWIIGICLLIAYVIAYLSVSQIVPTYRASTTVMFDIQRTNVVDLQSVLAEEGFDRRRLQDQILVLSSSSLIERVIDETRLDQNPEFNPKLREPEASFGDRVGDMIALPPEVTDFFKDLGLARQPPPPPADPQIVSQEAQERERVAMVNRVLNQLDLEPIGDSRVLNISFTSTNPRTAALIANTIADQYIVDQLEAKLEATRAATSWLAERVEELRIRVQDAEGSVEETRAVITDERGQSLELTRQQLSALNGALGQARSQKTIAQTTYTRLNEALSDPDAINSVSEFRNAPGVVALRNQETKLQTEITALQGSVAENNPTLTLAQRQLESLRRQIEIRSREEAQRIVAAAAADLETAEQQETALLAQVQELEQTALLQSSDEIRLRELEREAQASRVLYENFLGRLQETNAQEDLETADARVLTRAEVPLGPEQQRQNRTMFLTMFLGGIVGTAIVFLLNFLNNTFRTPQQLEELTGETVLGAVPSAGIRMKRHLVLDHLKEKPGSSMAEAIRNLRTSVLMSNVDRPPKTIMFTSSVPREGKSTTAMMTAMTSRQMGKSAIIVDCDLRLPALARMVKEEEDNRPGLMTVLSGECEVDDAIYRDPDTGLHVLMTKTSERQGAINAADALSSHRFKQLLDQLKETYELVILDTPPAVVVTDARILSSLVDSVIFVVRWDKTPRGAVQEGLKELRSVNAPIAGMVMTLINEARATRYSYDGYSYYRGRYKDYYTS